MVVSEVIVIFSYVANYEDYNRVVVVCRTIHEAWVVLHWEEVQSCLLF